jgi:hypothetical protein
MSAVCCSADNDGDLDLFVANYAGLREGIFTNELYRNDGDGNLKIVSGEAAYANLTDRRYGASIGLDGSTLSDSMDESLPKRIAGAADACWGDYDGDGFVDLFLAMGGYQPSQFELLTPSKPGYRNLLYHNEGVLGGIHQGFALITSGVGDLLISEYPSTGCAFADYDGVRA